MPTVAQKRGDSSRTFDNAGRLMPIYDPLSGRFEGNNWVRSAFPGNIIPADRINPTSAKILSLYPDPNSSTPGSPDWQNNFVLSPNKGRFDFHNYNARIDHNFDSRQRIYGRWSWNRHESLRIKNAIPGIGADHRTGGKTNNGIGFAGVKDLPRSPFDGDYNNIQPRVGAAFQLTSRTVLRGGCGVFYTSPISRGFTNGFSIQTPYVATLDAGRTPANDVSNPFPGGDPNLLMGQDLRFLRAQDGPHPREHEGAVPRGGV